jgi:hypothetical protein
MLFHRKTFADVIKSMTPYEGNVYFRDSAEKGAFEVICLKGTKFTSEKILMKAVFQSEDAGIFSGDVGVIGEPFYANAQDVLAAIAGKDPFAEYKDGLFDGVAVDRYFDGASANTHGRILLRESLDYYDKWQKNSVFHLKIHAEEHRIVARNIKNFPTAEAARYSMNSVCFHFNAEDDIQLAATDGKSLAVYYLPGKTVAEATWTVPPDMLFVPPYNYDSVTFTFSKEAVSMLVHGRPEDPVITAYAVALEWQRLREIRKEMEQKLAGGGTTREESEASIKECLEKGPEQVFANYGRVIPYNNTERMILDRNEIMLGLEKLKRSLYNPRYGGSKVFVIDALDPENIFLTSVTDISDYDVSYTQAKLPLKKAETSHPIRTLFTLESFVKCCLEGGDKIELKFQNARAAFMTEGADYFKGHSVNVKKIFMPFCIPKYFNDYGFAPEVKTEITEPSEDAGEDDEGEDSDG